MVALLVGLSTLALYARTLLPHLGGTEDTAKFQYLGYVLGTGHSPGYPLYALVSHAFSYLPVGSLAYRMNLMSACFGAVAAALMYLVLRHFRAHPLTCAAVALAFASGRFFWKNAVIAEVYTLGVALAVAAVVKVLDWQGSRRDRDLYWAVGWAALALGNHLTILAIAPALALYVVLTDPGRVRLRVVAVSAGLVALGMAQYSYIWIRTLQGGVQIEARARNLEELIAVLTARQFASGILAFDYSELFFERIPEFAQLFLAELGPIALPFAALGLLLLILRRPREAVLFVAGALGVSFLSLNIAGADDEAMLLSAFALTWPVVEIGLEGARSGLDRRLGGRAGVALLGAVLLLPAAQMARNYQLNDQSAGTFESRYFRALFDQVPAPAAFVDENYVVNHLMRYMVISGEAGGRTVRFNVRRDPHRIRQLLDEGMPVFAFPAGREALMARGLEFTPVRLKGETLQQYLEQVVDGRIVAIAGTGPGLTAETAASIGLEDRQILRRGRRFAILGVKGATGAAAALRGREAAAGLQVLSIQEIGGTRVAAPVDLEAAAAARGGVILVDGEEVARVKSGIAVALVASDGSVADTRVFDSRLDMRAPLDMGPLSLFRVTSGAP